MSQKNKPLITIITVTYNLIEAARKEYFQQCLESVHNQTYENIEHIIIDGASDDGTVKLIEKYKNKGWITYISEKDEGIYDAMNKGIKKANGKYIAFLNSDDFYHNKKGLSKVIEILEENNADFSYSAVNLINEDGSVHKSNHPSKNPDISRVFLKTPFCHQTMIARKTMMDEIGGFNIKYKIAADYDLILKASINEYSSIFAKVDFVTYRLSGISSWDTKKRTAEFGQIQFENFSLICHITEAECIKLCDNNYKNFPLRLAIALTEKTRYFDIEKYIKKVNLDSLRENLNAQDLFFIAKHQNNLLFKLQQDNINIKKTKLFQFADLCSRSMRKPHKIATFPINLLRILLK